MDKLNEFLELINSNDKDKMKIYIIDKGKEGKPFCPISFTIGEKNNDKSEDE